MEKMRQRAVSWCPGSTFPTPYPQGYGATPPLPRPAQSTCDVSGSMPEAGPVWQCRMRCTRTSRIRMTVLRDRSVPLRTPPPAPHPAPSTAAAPGGPGGPGGRTEAVPPAPPVPPTRRKGLGRSGTSGPAGQEVPGGLLIPAGRKGRDCSLDDGGTPPLGRPDTPIQVARRSAAPGGATPPNCPGGAHGSTRSRGVVRRSIGQFLLTRPVIFSQLLTPADSLPKWPINPLATRQEETARYASTRRGWAINTTRTSQHGRRVKRFVIECIPPSCLVDITPVGELVTTAPRDAVDSILGNEGWGLVQDRGEMCRSDRPARTRKTRTPRGA